MSYEGPERRAHPPISHDSLKVKTPLFELGVTGQFNVIAGLLVIVGGLVIWHGHLTGLDLDEIARLDHLILDRQRLIQIARATCPNAEWISQQYEATEQERKELKALRDKRKGMLK